MSTNGFKFVEHPTDIDMVIWASSAEKLFEQAALALTEFCYPTISAIKNPELSAKISCNEDSWSELLHQWLNEIITITNKKNACINEFSFRYFSEKQVTAVIYGRRVNKPFRLKKVLRATVYNKNHRYRAEITAII